MVELEWVAVVVVKMVGNYVWWWCRIGRLGVWVLDDPVGDILCTSSSTCLIIFNM